MPRLLYFLALVFLAVVPRAVAQDSTPVRPRVFQAVSQTVLTNVVVNRLDAWVFNMPTQRVSLSSWKNNLRTGWEWDENGFNTNLFMHPFHGSTYFNAGRDNGLDFWESAPLSFLGSWIWEYLGETNRPALNDFFMTSFGGVALGEMFHRVSALVRDNGARGGGWWRRELATLPLDPLGAVNRFVGRSRIRSEPNPAEHSPGTVVVRLHAGARVVPDSAIEHYGAQPAAMLDFVYGNPWNEPYSAPFDVFTMRASVGQGGINLLRVSGRLYGKDLNGPQRRFRHLFMVNQRFDYIDNAAYQVGGQSIEAGIASRWRLGNTLGLRTQFFGDVIVLGGIDAPGAGFGLRNYDFGPGAGLRIQIALERSGAPFLLFAGQSEYVHSVSGASAEHFIDSGVLELTLPVWRKLGLTAQTIGYKRVSRYSDRPRDERRHPEVRLFLSWTSISHPQ